MLAGLVMVSVFSYFGVAEQVARRVSSSRTDGTFAFAGSNIIPLTSLPGEERSPAFSPDGNQVAFWWAAPQAAEADLGIYVKQIGSEAIRRLTRGPGSDSHPVWSPDAKYVAVIRRFPVGVAPKGSIVTVPALGGTERTIWEGDVHSAGLDWSPDGKHLLFAGTLASDTGARALRHLSLLSTRRRSGTSTHRTARQRSGRQLRSFLTRWPTDRIRARHGGGADVYVMPASGGEPRRLTFGHRNITSLVWFSQGQRLIFSDSTRDMPSTTLWKVDSSGGRPDRLTASPEPAIDLATDRSGRRLVFTRRVHDTNIHRIDLSGPHPGERPLVASTRRDGDPQISPDAQQIVFSSERSGTQQIWIAKADGSELRQVTSMLNRSRHPVWSPDGQQIAFASIPSNRVRDEIYVINLDGGPARQLTDDAATNVWPVWSRDGQSIYFTSYRTGAWELWKVPASGGRPSQVTRGGGLRAPESSDGRFLYYSKSPPAIWRRPVNGGEETFVLQLPTLPAWGGEWTLVPSGIYFQKVEARGDPS